MSTDIVGGAARTIFTINKLYLNKLLNHYQKKALKIYIFFTIQPQQTEPDLKKRYNQCMKNNSTDTPKMIGFAAYSGTGKTTLLKQVIPLLTKHGLRLAIIKHSHHDFEIDQPGKDSYELHHAGSCQTLLTSKYRSALITENSPQQEPELFNELKKLDLSTIDLVLVEGFRHERNLTRIELHRPSRGKPFLHTEEENIIAVASDESLDINLPLLDINNPNEISQFVINWLDN